MINEIVSFTQTHPQIMNLAVFLFGGVGVAVLQIVFEWIKNSLKRRFEKENILMALRLENEEAKRLCQTIVHSLDGHLLSVHSFAQFRSTWFQKYTDSFLDFSKQEDINMYSFLSGAIGLMRVIEQLNANSNNLNASSRALGSFHALITNVNQGTLDRTRELLKVLESLSFTKKELLLLLNKG